MKPGKWPFRQFPDWINPKVLILMILLALFSVAMVWSEPLPKPNRVSNLARAAIPLAITPEAEPGTPEVDGQTVTTRTPTPIPLEWANNREMANGIVLGAVALVVIIVGGTLISIRRRTS